MSILDSRIAKGWRLGLVLGVVAVAPSMGCSALYGWTRPSDCEAASSLVIAAFQYESLDALKKNVAALALSERLDAYVYGIHCTHPPMLFLAETLQKDGGAVAETLRRMSREISDSERTAYLELVREFQYSGTIDINTNVAIARQVQSSISLLKRSDIRTGEIERFRRIGVAIEGPSR